MSLFRSNKKRILYASFNSLQYLSLVFWMPVIVALYYSELSSAYLFGLMGIFVFAIANVVKRQNKTKEELDSTDAMIVVGLIWIIASVFGAIPITLMSELNFFDSTFESVSAWTTTGFSILSNVESLPKALLFFRSLMQWIGGIGIVVAVLAGIFKLGGQRLYFSEAREERIQPNMLNTIRTIWILYLAFTVLGFILFHLSGMSVFDSINHSMTAISTGGLSSKNEGIASYSSLPISLVTILIMLLGAISFSLHYDLIKGKVKKFFSDPQIISLFSVIFIASILSIAFISLPVIFTIVSALTCTGFSLLDISRQAESFKVLLVVLMIIGGSAGSTAGGIKLMRLWIFVKSISWKVKSTFKPHMVIKRDYGGVNINEDAISNVTQYILLYAIIFVLGSIVISLLGYPFTDSMLEVASAQANVGLSSGIVSPLLSPIGKLVLMAHMLIGRLEIFAVLILISSFFVKK